MTKIVFFIVKSFLFKRITKIYTVKIQSVSIFNNFFVCLYSCLRTTCNKRLTALQRSSNEEV